MGEAKPAANQKACPHHAELAELDEAIEQHRAAGERRQEARALVNRGWLLFGERRYEDALASFEGALAIQREIGDTSGEARTVKRKSMALVMSGSIREGLDLMGRWMELDTASRLPHERIDFSAFGASFRLLLRSMRERY